MRKINLHDTTDTGAESVRLGVNAAKKGKRTVQSAQNTAASVRRAARTAVRAVQSVLVHTAAVLISPVTWVLLAAGLVVYLITALLILLNGAAVQQHAQQQQAYTTPVALGENIPDEIRQAKAMFDAAADAQKQAYTAKIDELRYSTADMPHNDTVYLVRNEPSTTFDTSLATNARKTQLKNAWNFGLSQAEGIAIAYVYLEKEANAAHSSEGVLYPVTFTQDVFDEIAAKAVRAAETQYKKQSCPGENCAVHPHETANPAYAEALAEYNLAASRYRDWCENVMPVGAEYAEALRSYRATPAAGQTYAWTRVKNAADALTRAVNQWSADYGVRGLTVDEELCGKMETQLGAAQNAAAVRLQNTPETTASPVRSCDRQHTLHSISLQFYSAEEVMQMLRFTGEEQQWAAMTAVSVQQYLQEDAG